MVDITERAPEIAGFAALVVAVVPWSVSFSSGPFSGFIALRFVFGVARFSLGARSADVEHTVLSVFELETLYSAPNLTPVSTLWLVVAALAVVALLVGLALLVAGDRLTVGPIDPVRVMGALCLCMALALSGATWLLFQHTDRTPIPVGLLALYLFGAGLLTVDRGYLGSSATEASG